MKPILTHTIWLLLAGGAYVVGTLHRGVAPASLETGGRGVAEAPPDPLGFRAGSAPLRFAKSTMASESADFVRWLDSFRNREGLIAAERMKEAMRTAVRHPDPSRSMFYFSQLIKELTIENAPAALKGITENTGGAESTRYLSLLAHAWGEKGGQLALDGLDALRGPESDQAKGTALAAWAATDSDTAMKWIRERNAQKNAASLPQSESEQLEDSALKRGMITGLARGDVDVALQYLQTLDLSDQSEFIGVLAQQKLKESPTVGAAWAERLPTEEMRIVALEAVGNQLLRQDLDTAVQWAEKVAARPDAHDAVGGVASEMARRNPLEAAAWVSRLPGGASQEQAFEEVFAPWTRSDPMAASQSLAGMAPGPGRDSAIQAFSRTLARESPMDALAWAKVMTDPEDRADVQIYIARRWQATAPQEAKAWIAANLPPGLQIRDRVPQK